MGCGGSKESPQLFLDRAGHDKVVMRGLDPRIHQKEKFFCEEDGLPGQALLYAHI